MLRRLPAPESNSRRASPSRPAPNAVSARSAKLLRPSATVARGFGQPRLRRRRQPAAQLRDAATDDRKGALAWREEELTSRVERVAAQEPGLGAQHLGAQRLQRQQRFAHLVAALRLVAIPDEEHDGGAHRQGGEEQLKGRAPRRRNVWRRARFMRRREAMPRPRAGRSFSRVPRPGGDCASSRPPCSSTMPRAIAQPQTGALARVAAAHAAKALAERGRHTHRGTPAPRRRRSREAGPSVGAGSGHADRPVTRAEVDRVAQNGAKRPAQAVGVAHERRVGGSPAGRCLTSAAAARSARPRRAVARRDRGDVDRHRVNGDASGVELEHGHRVVDERLHSQRTAPECAAADSRCSALSGPPAGSSSSSANPRISVSGVRSSWAATRRKRSCMRARASAPPSAPAPGAVPLMQLELDPRDEVLQCAQPQAGSGVCAVVSSTHTRPSACPSAERNVTPA